MLKLLWTAIALAAAVVAAPIASDAPLNRSLQAARPSASFPDALPIGALLSTMALILIANRRRNLRKVLC